MRFDPLQPVAHAAHHGRDERKRRRVMVGPWVVVDTPVYLLVRVASTLRTELPDSPILAMFGVEEVD